MLYVEDVHFGDRDEGRRIIQKSLTKIGFVLLS